ncbi:hypothetical protein NA57DRAFT_79727 [Rhizodiscina lignyota]|uniref:Imidazoleglycerol-phosphate dehydratase n=1 Tax=Rhizodiscina lignyota TaxID=1504668 RepID=A0A9P4I855_9PEZI|nr:hypothetical protein NA57DRAFT_79727 [Rhizodiscina lignyota]
MRQHGSLQNDEEINAAAWEAARGAVTGAVRWGIYSGLVGAAAYFYSPIYRGLTIQFKVFLQMSGMCIGSMIEADQRLRLYETQVRRQKRLQRDAAVWQRYEAEFEARRAAIGQGQSEMKTPALRNDNVTHFAKSDGE